MGLIGYCRYSNARALTHDETSEEVLHEADHHVCWYHCDLYYARVGSGCRASGCVCVMFVHAVSLIFLHLFWFDSKINNDSAIAYRKDAGNWVRILHCVNHLCFHGAHHFIHIRHGHGLFDLDTEELLAMSLEQAWTSLRTFLSVKMPVSGCVK